MSDIFTASSNFTSRETGLYVFENVVSSNLEAGQFIILGKAPPGFLVELNIFLSVGVHILAMFPKNIGTNAYIYYTKDGSRLTKHEGIFSTRGTIQYIYYLKQGIVLNLKT